MNIPIADADPAAIDPLLTMPNRSEVFVAIEGTVRDEQDIFKIKDVKERIELMASYMVEAGLKEYAFSVLHFTCELASELVETESDDEKGFLFEVAIGINDEPMAEMRMLLISPLLPEEREALYIRIERAEGKPSDLKWN